MNNNLQANGQTVFIKIMKSIFIVFIIVTIILTGVGFRSKSIDMAFESDNVIEWNDGWKIFVNYNQIEETTIPVKIDGITTEIIEIRHRLPDNLGGKNSLLIESKRQDTKVYINGFLRKSLSSSELRQGRSLPYEYMIVPLDSRDSAGFLSITYSSDSVYSGNIGTVYMGDQISLILMLLQRNTIWLVLISVMVAVGLLCFVFRFIYRKSFERARLFSYVGAFCVFASMYGLNQLRIKQCFIKDLPMLEVLGFSALMLVPYSILMISYGVSHFKNRKIVTVLGFLALFNFIFQQINHNVTNADYFTMQSITQILILLVLGILIIANLCDKDKETYKDSRFMALTCGYLLVGSIVEAVLTSLDTDMPVGSVYLIASVIFAFNVLVYCFSNISRENEGKKKAELANKAKSEFLSVMSHEIRTPINAIVGINEIISRETKEESTRKYSSNIADASNSLLYLVNDILDYSKIESGKLDIVDVEYDVKKTLDEMNILTESRLRDKALEYRFEVDDNIPSVLYGDVARIRQVCINLITNAIKYTQEGGFRVTVRCQEIIDDKVKLFFSVKDTGIGIREEDREKIIGTEFVRLDSKKNYNVEGTGLGLAITSKLLVLMGSELKLESVYGEGSDFYFIIEQKIIDKTPIKDKKNLKNTDKKEVVFKCPNANILVVDDVNTNLIVMKGLLKQFEINAVVCDSGEECIEKCRNEKFDIIFLDMMMPGLNGHETLDILKKEDIISNTTVIALTANAISGAKETYLSQGFDEYMTKPIQMSELEEMLLNKLDASLIEK